MLRSRRNTDFQLDFEGDWFPDLQYLPQKDTVNDDSEGFGRVYVSGIFSLSYIEDISDFLVENSSKKGGLFATNATVRAAWLSRQCKCTAKKIITIIRISVTIIIVVVIIYCYIPFLVLAFRMILLYFTNIPFILIIIILIILIIIIIIIILIIIIISIIAIIVIIIFIIDYCSSNKLSKGLSLKHHYHSIITSAYYYFHTIVSFCDV